MSRDVSAWAATMMAAVMPTATPKSVATYLRTGSTPSARTLAPASGRGYPRDVINRQAHFGRC